MSLGEFSIQISLFSKAKFTRTGIYSISRLTTQDSLVTSSDLDRKLYREVVLSFTFNRVLDKNFTFFKSKIHSNWHIFNLTTNHSRLFTVRYSVFSNPYSIFGIHHSPLTTHHSRLTCHFEWFSNENLIEKCFEVLRLDEFSIQISLFSKAKFTRTDMYSSSPLKTHLSPLIAFKPFNYITFFSFLHRPKKKQKRLGSRNSS